MEIDKIVLFKKDDCPYCAELEEFIPTAIADIGKEGMLFITINIDTVDNADVKTALANRGVPFVEFRNSQDKIIFTAPGLPTLNEEALAKDGFDLSSVTDEDKVNLKINLVKQVFLIELANANVTALSQSYKEDDLKAVIQSQTKGIIAKAKEFQLAINEILTKYKL